MNQHSREAQLHQLNGLCDEFELQWSQDKSPDLSTFLARVGNDVRQRGFRELLLIEVSVRRGRGENVEVSDYLDRFHSFASIVRSVILAPTETHIGQNTIGNVGVRGKLELPQWFGQYELLEEIGRGGMGVVVRAEQASLERTVAIKMILPGGAATGEHIERFLAEAKSVARLQHPGIVAIYDVGEERGQHFFSMEYVAGQSLSQLLEKGPLINELAAQFALQIAEAMHYAHGQSVLHRDLKPANVLVDQSGRAKVTDFGLAKRVDTEEELTVAGQVLGTPAYMSPEQARGDQSQIDERSDVYSLGAVLYSLLTARVPFRGESTMATLLDVIQKAPKPPSKIASDVDPQLERICLKCLAKEPENRYGTAADLAMALEEFLEKQASPSPPPVAGGLEPLVPPPPREPAGKWRPRLNTVSIIVASILGVTIIGTLVGVLLNNRTPTAKKADDVKPTAAPVKKAPPRAAKNTVKTKKVARKGVSTAKSSASKSPKIKAPVKSSFTIRHTLFGHSAAITDLAFSPDGKILLSSGGDGRVRRWDPARGGPSKLFLRRRRGVTAVRFSPAGDKVYLCGDDRQMSGWSFPNAKRLFQVDDSLYLKRLAVSPDGSRIVTSTSGGSIPRLWSSATGEEVCFFPETNAGSGGLAFSPDNRLLAIGSGDFKIRLYDADTGASLNKVVFGVSPVQCLTFSPDGRSLASGHVRGELSLISVGRWKTRKVFRQHRGPIQALAFSGDGKRLVTVGNDGKVRIWDPRIPELLSVHEDHPTKILALALSRDGRTIATGGVDKRIKIWDLNYPGRASPIVVPLAKSHPPGRKQTHSLAKTRVAVRVKRTMSGHQGRITALAISPDGSTLLSAGFDKTVRKWDLKRASQGRIFARHENLVTDVVYSGDGKTVYSCGDDRTIRIWRAKSGNPIGSIAESQQIRQVAISPDGSRLASGVTGGPHKPRLWDAQTRKEIRLFAEANGGTAGVAFSPKRSLLALGSGDYNLRIYDAIHGRPVRKQILTGHPITNLCFSPNGERLVVGQQPGRLIVFDTRNWKQLKAIVGPRGAINDMAFSSRGRLVVVTTGGQLWLWNLSENLPRAVQSEHKTRLFAVAISADGRLIATAGEDSIIKLWSADP